MLFIHRPMNATALHKYSPYIHLAHTTHCMCSCPSHQAVFSFLYFKKIKISKLYVHFGKFQKYILVALWGRQGSNVIFFSNLQRSPWSKKRGGACRPLGGRQGPLPFYKTWPTWPPYAAIPFVI